MRTNSFDAAITPGNGSKLLPRQHYTVPSDIAHDAMRTRKSVFNQTSGSAFLATLVLLVVLTAFDVVPITLSGTSTKATGGSPAALTWYYKASADVTYPGLSGPVTAHVRRVFEMQIDNAWRYMTYYEYDLEAQPDNQTIIMGG